MQITLSSQQSKALELISQRGGYTSLEDAIDTALVLLADETTKENAVETPEYLAWLEGTRLKIEEGERSADIGETVDVDDVLSKLRNKVEIAKATST
ncbi:MAG: hypothetical protein AAFR25_05975 [Cyanobacteria bacterium J06629_19]